MEWIFICAGPYDVAKAEGNTVVVIAYELGGRFGGEALKFFDDIARASTSTSAAAAAFKSYWLRRISTAAQKAHGALLRARLPRLPAPTMEGMRAPPAPLAHITENANLATIGPGAHPLPTDGSFAVPTTLARTAA